MHKMSINRQVVEVTKNEAKEAQRIASMRTADPEHAQRAADIWMRSAPLPCLIPSRSCNPASGPGMGLACPH